MKITALLCGLVMLGSSSVALAADSAHSMHGGMHMETAHSREYNQAMEAMHTDMMTGIMDADPDRAFVLGMLPHHEGAVHMARIQLKYGKDPEMKKLAQDIIDAQEKEIKMMQDWLKAHPKP